MRLKVAVLGVVLGLSIAPLAHAAASQSFSLQAGAAVPLGDVSDLAQAGFRAGFGYDARVGSTAGLGVDAGWIGLGEKTESGDLYGSLLVVGLKTSILDIGLHGDLLLAPANSTTQPYVRLGMGLYNFSQKMSLTISDGAVSQSASQTESEAHLGFELGAGLQVKTGESGAFGIDLTYHLIPMSSTSKLATSTKDSQHVTSVLVAGASYHFPVAH